MPVLHHSVRRDNTVTTYEERLQERRRRQGKVTAHCRCCHRALGDSTAKWCGPCLVGVAKDVERLQTLDPGALILLSDIFTTCGAFFLVRAMVGALPFERVVDE